MCLNMTHDCDLTIFLFHWFLMQVVLFLFTILSKLKKIYALGNFMLTAQRDDPGSADKTDWQLCVICQQSIKEKPVFTKPVTIGSIPPN